MIAVTHSGKAGDFGLCFPVCSWLHKTYNEKIIFVLPRFAFATQLESLIRLQPFTEDVIYCDFNVLHYDMGGQPYKFNPHDYVKNLNISRYYNFGFKAVPDKYVPEYYAEEYGLGVDNDYVLELGLNFVYDKTKIICSEVLSGVFPNYTQPDFNKDFLSNLQDIAYAKERHLHFSSLAVFIGLARIPFYMYLIQKWAPIVNNLNFDKIVKINPEHYWLYFKNVSVLDIIELDDENKIRSAYDKVFFNKKTKI